MVYLDGAAANEFFLHTYELLRSSHAYNQNKQGLLFTDSKGRPVVRFNWRMKRFDGRIDEKFQVESVSFPNELSRESDGTIKLGDIRVPKNTVDLLLKGILSSSEDPSKKPSGTSTRSGTAK